mgnify:CR=1 FL=1
MGHFERLKAFAGIVIVVAIVSLTYNYLFGLTVIDAQFAVPDLSQRLLGLLIPMGFAFLLYIFSKYWSF